MTPLPPSAIAARDSDIHGHGVYAQQSIAEGDFITEYTGERITLAEAAQREKTRQSLFPSEGTAASDYLYILDDETAIDGRDTSNIARLINHACEPNCRSDVIGDRIWIIATRDITIGEEITFDYCYTFKDGLHHPCRCGGPKCVGYIIARDQRWRLRRWRANQALMPGRTLT